MLLDTGKIIIILINIPLNDIEANTKKSEHNRSNYCLTLLNGNNEFQKRIIHERRGGSYIVLTDMNAARNVSSPNNLNSNSPMATGRHRRRSAHDARMFGRRGAAVARESPRQSCPYTTTDGRARQ